MYHKCNTLQCPTSKPIRISKSEHDEFNNTINYQLKSIHKYNVGCNIKSTTNNIKQQIDIYEFKNECSQNKGNNYNVKGIFLKYHI